MIEKRKIIIRTCNRSGQETIVVENVIFRMTVVDVSAAPQSGALGTSAAPRHRALLPRNPTPWSAPVDAAPLPVQVQRLLQQVGEGVSYRTYQPFQVVQPMILPENNPVPSFIQSPPPSSTLLLPNSITRKVVTVLASPNNDDSCMDQQHPVSSTNYNPVLTTITTTDVSHVIQHHQRPRHHHDTPPQPFRTPCPLTQLCRRRLVAHYGLRGLRQLLLTMEAPRCLAKYLSTLDARECTVRLVIAV